MKWYIFIFLFAGGGFLAHYLLAGEAVYGDGIDYWSHLHSWRFGKIFDYDSEYKHVYSPENNNLIYSLSAPVPLKTRITSLEKTDNPHPPGTAVLLLPWYVWADELAGIFHLPRNGYSDIYQIFCGIGVVTYVVLGLFICERIINRVVGKSPWVRWGIIGIFMATPLLYYGVYDVINSHGVSFFVAALFWYKYLTWKLDKKSDYLYLGMILGLAFIIRLQEVLLWLPVLYKLVKNRPRQAGVKLVLLFISFAVVIFPLVWQWKTLYGGYWPETYIIGRTFKDWWGVFIHPTNGLFSVSPILVVSISGILMGVRKYPIVFLMGIIFLMQIVAVSYQGGWSDAAYGARMFISSLVAAAFGLTIFLNYISRRFDVRWVKLCLLFLIIMNMLNIGQFTLFKKQVNSGMKQGLEEHVEKRLEYLKSIFLYKISSSFIDLGN